jgi:monoamine oxidase
MSRSLLMQNLVRAMRIAHFCEGHHIATREGLERVAAIEARAAKWRSTRQEATAARAILTDYSSGIRGASLNPVLVETEAGLFLNDLDQIFPGALTGAARDAQGKLRVHLEPWPSNPFTKGSYTCYRPGQFTTIAGNEGKPIGNIHFAGEHANSFYEAQGFMEQSSTLQSLTLSTPLQE